MPIFEVSGVAVVFLLIVAVLVAFVTEVVPNDVTAISVVAALVILEPWTGVGSRAAISGFANPRRSPSSRCTCSARASRRQASWNGSASTSQISPPAGSSARSSPPSVRPAPLQGS